jgi:hypothetical protein
MKSDGNVRHKLKQVKFRHTKHEIEDLLSPSPANCTYNIGEGDFHKCSLQEQPMVICDKRYGGLEVASSCPNFQPKYDKEQIKESLSNFFLNSSIPDIARRYPDMAALLWVLGDPEDRTELLGDEVIEEELVPEQASSFLPELELKEASYVEETTITDALYNILVFLKLAPKRLEVVKSND